MLGTKFYHSALKNCVVGFGTLFNNITIDRVSTDGSTVLQSIKVPLSYSPREKFLRRIEERNSIDAQPDVKAMLPRMAFEIENVAYDPSRKLPTIKKLTKATNDSTTLYSSYMRVPYTVSLGLNIAARNSEDAFRIIEQILPYFTPEFNVTVKDISNTLNNPTDVSIVLTGVSQDGSYTGGFEDDDFVLWSLSFDAKVFFYSPVTSQGVITTSIANVYIDGWSQEAIETAIKAEKITVTAAIMTFNTDSVKGTIYTTAGDSTNDSAVGTSFSHQLKSGSTISISGDSVLHKVKYLNDDTSITIDSTFSTTLSNKTLSKAVGTFTKDEYIFLYTDKDGKRIADKQEDSPKKAIVVAQAGSNNEIVNIRRLNSIPRAGEIWKGSNSGATGEFSSITDSVDIVLYIDSTWT